ncbi:MAG: helix-turn-helix domain-containing protein [Thermomicrobiales bacterium]
MPEHSELGKLLIQGSEEVLAYQRGERALREHRVPITARGVIVLDPPHYDAARIRALRQQLALSQQLFADALNVSLATVRAWEQGLRVPEGATRRLLEIAEEHPEYFTSKISA